MFTPYSLDLKRKSVLAYENGDGTQYEITERFSIGLRTFQEWLTLKNETGDADPKKHIYRGKKLVIVEKWPLFVKGLVEKSQIS